MRKANIYTSYKNWICQILSGILDAHQLLPQKVGGMATDLADNVALVIPPLQAQYVGDGNDPNIFNFLEVDLGLRRMIVEFNEPVDISTAIATMFTL